MSDTIIGLVPVLGPYLVFGVIFLASLAVPLPASLLTLTAGSFAASGELSFTIILISAFAAFVLGDQVAFGLARAAGPRFLPRLEASTRFGPIIARSQDLLQRRGALAVLLSHTIMSPTCPYVSYLCGAGGLSWRAFTLTALPGAAIWTGVYLYLGYLFAGQLETVMETISHFFGFILAGCVVLGCVVILRSRWREGMNTT